ncbi:MAG: two-component system, chemotaxis family, protein-glutamate methylesterase/glutaminase, partial [Acidimicrobiia bacterium]|nr:two-component system, chemotaxis family, protein-glutamate methylesterase/glutaminase [Acidimicrobiia bacterium]
QAAHVGVPSEWPCPDCSGVLWQVDDEPVFRFSCRVGHAWTAESLLEQQGDEVDTALWMALRTLEDRASLSQMLADRAAAGGRRSSAARFRVGLDEMNRSIEVLRRLLTLGGGGTGDMG